MLCSKFTSEVYCTMQLALFDQQAEHPGIQNGILHSWIGSPSHWVNECGSMQWLNCCQIFPFFANENFKSFQNILMADRQRYNFSSRSFSWTTIIWILSHQKSESIISIRMCSQWEKDYFKSKCWINLLICKYLGHWRPKSLTIVDDIALSQVYLASSLKSPYKILNLSN